LCPLCHRERFPKGSGQKRPPVFSPPRPPWPELLFFRPPPFPPPPLNFPPPLPFFSFFRLGEIPRPPPPPQPRYLWENQRFPPNSFISWPPFPGPPKVERERSEPRDPPAPESSEKAGGGPPLHPRAPVFQVPLFGFLKTRKFPGFHEKLYETPRVFFFSRLENPWIQPGVPNLGN